MQLVIIAGGKGTRLGLKDIPKPMVRIADKPILEHQINLAKQYGINEIFILSGHLSEVIKNYFGDGSNFGVKIHHIVEPHPLGTAGCLKLLEGKLKDRFMVFYGDVVMDFDILSFIQFDSKYKDSIGTAIVHPNDHPYDSDLLELDDFDNVIKILSKPHPENIYYQNLVNAAVYIFSIKIFDYINSGIPQDFGKDILPKIVSSGEILKGYRTSEYIKDMGTADRFNLVTQDFLSGKVSKLNKKNTRACIFLDRDGVINKDMGTNPIPSNFELLPNVAKSIKKINKSTYLTVIVTNQPMIAKGFVSVDEVEQTNKKLETLLGKEHCYIDRIYYCPHHPEKGFKGEVESLKISCSCRKPNPGMLLQAAKDLNIDFATSWMIGDSWRDIEAGKRVGCKTIYISNDNNLIDADFVVNDLKNAVNIILGESNDNN